MVSLKVLGVATIENALIVSKAETRKGTKGQSYYIYGIIPQERIHFPPARGPEGLSIKYVTLDGGGGREDVTDCDRGRESRACDVTLIIFYHTYET